MFLANPFKPDLRVLREARSLVDNGHQVCVQAWDRECKLPLEEEFDGVRVIRHPIRADYGEFLSLVPGFILFYIHLILAGLGSDLDAVHCHDMDTMVPGLIVTRLKSIRLVYDMHESYPDFISTFAPRPLVRILRLLEPFLIRRADMVLATSTPIAGIARESGGKRVITVMNCFEPFSCPEEEVEGLRESLASDEEFLMVYIGGLFPNRGLEEAVRAVSMLEGVNLFIGGYGPIEGKLRSMVGKLEVDDRVIFGGEIDPTLVPAYDLASDLLFALYKGNDPNNVLTVPNKLFESIAAGKPILVSDLGEKSRIVKAEGNGLAVDPEKVEEVADSIRTIMDDDIYDRMSRAALDAQNRYNWRKMAGRLVDGYSSLLE